MVECFVNAEFRRTWKDVALSYFKALSLHFSGVAEEDRWKRQSGYPSCRSSRML